MNTPEKTVKAVQIKACGSYDVLHYGDYEIPTIVDFDVLVKVIK